MVDLCTVRGPPDLNYEVTEVPGDEESASEYSSEGENDEVSHVGIGLSENKKADGCDIQDVHTSINDYQSEDEIDQYFDACSNLGDESLAGEMQAPELS